MTPLTPELVRRVFAEEAARYGVSFDDVVGRRRYAAALGARRDAIKRVARETGANPYQIARVWGADHTVVADLLAAPDGIHPYDKRTLSQLVFLRGPQRAAAIVSGLDIEAELDRALWRHLGTEAA